MASSSDIRQKDVINVTDGRKLGNIVDMELTKDGRIESITVPGPMKIMDMLKGQKNGMIIPWSNVVKIGDDVILVELDSMIP